MGLSKTARIQILLTIDVVFFLLEIVSGYAVHSLALVADSFHMLNDVISLCVGLWAVKVANSTTNNKMYTYGWQRAETLGALVNGVFLVALCLSIFLDALQRFFEPQEVLHPKLVLIVGCFGLASNFVGLLLFHDHSHGGGGGHAHSHAKPPVDKLSAAEQGHAQGHGDLQDSEATIAITDESGNVADVLPQTQVSDPPSSNNANGTKHVTYGTSNGVSDAYCSNSPGRTNRKHSRSRSRAYSGLEDIPVHPASFRNEIIAASKIQDDDSTDSVDTELEDEQAVPEADNQEADESSSLLPHKSKSRRKSLSSASLHKSHNHNPSKRAAKKASGGGGGHGHSHADLNMRGVFLHVMGDALGNLGVIASALFIWLTDFSWRFYADPVISLVITVIILGSAIPLCLAASRILLQAVPRGLSIDDIKQDIEALPDVYSCHHLHVWQLSDTKLVASLHLKIAFEFKDEGSRRYMALARQIRACLHEYGIHSSTIQPEFCSDADHGHRMVQQAHREHEEHAESDQAAKDENDTCLLDCDEECGPNAKCCPPVKPVVSSNGGSGSGSHEASRVTSRDDHDHDHDH